MSLELNFNSSAYRWNKQILSEQFSYQSSNYSTYRNRYFCQEKREICNWKHARKFRTEDCHEKFISTQVRLLSHRNAYLSTEIKLCRVSWMHLQNRLMCLTFPKIFQAEFWDQKDHQIEEAKTKSQWEVAKV